MGITARDVADAVSKRATSHPRDPHYLLGFTEASMAELANALAAIAEGRGTSAGIARKALASVGLAEVA